LKLNLLPLKKIQMTILSSPSAFLAMAPRHCNPYTGTSGGSSQDNSFVSTGGDNTPLNSNDFDSESGATDQDMEDLMLFSDLLMERDWEGIGNLPWQSEDTDPTDLTNSSSPSDLTHSSLKTSSELNEGSATEARGDDEDPFEVIFGPVTQADQLPLPLSQSPYPVYPGSYTHPSQEYVAAPPSTAGEFSHHHSLAVTASDGARDYSAQQSAIHSEYNQVAQTHQAACHSYDQQYSLQQYYQQPQFINYPLQGQMSNPTVAYPDFSQQPQVQVHADQLQLQSPQHQQQQYQLLQQQNQYLQHQQHQQHQQQQQQQHQQHHQLHQQQQQEYFQQLQQQQQQQQQQHQLPKTKQRPSRHHRTLSSGVDDVMAKALVKYSEIKSALLNTIAHHNNDGDGTVQQASRDPSSARPALQPTVNDNTSTTVSGVQYDQQLTAPENAATVTPAPATATPAPATATPAPTATATAMANDDYVGSQSYELPLQLQSQLQPQLQPQLQSQLQPQLQPQQLHTAEHYYAQDPYITGGVQSPDLAESSQAFSGRSIRSAEDITPSYDSDSSRKRTRVDTYYPISSIGGNYDGSSISGSSSCASTHSTGKRNSPVAVAAAAASATTPASATATTAAGGTASSSRRQTRTPNAIEHAEIAKFPVRLFNAFNDGNLRKVMQIIDENCTDDCAHRTPSTSKIFIGKENLKNKFLSAASTYPDMVFLLKEAELLRRSDGTRIIAVKTYFSGTRTDTRRSFIDEIFSNKGDTISDAFFRDPKMTGEDIRRTKEFSLRSKLNGTPYRVFGKSMYYFTLNSDRKVVEMFTVVTLKDMKEV
jgi:hypothetical protein